MVQRGTKTELLNLLDWATNDGLITLSSHRIEFHAGGSIFLFVLNVTGRSEIEILRESWVLGIELRREAISRQLAFHPDLGLRLRGNTSLHEMLVVLVSLLGLSLFIASRRCTTSFAVSGSTSIVPEN